MKRLGFDPSRFAGAITAGKFNASVLAKGLGIQVVENVEEAVFILAHGAKALALPSRAICPMNLEVLEKVLEHCAVKRIPMVVVNPDFVTAKARTLSIMLGNDLLDCGSGLKDSKSKFKSC